MLETLETKSLELPVQDAIKSVLSDSSVLSQAIWIRLWNGGSVISRF